MSLATRYLPPKPQSESAIFIADFANLIPTGIGISACALLIQTNQSVPQPAPEWTQGPISIQGSRVWATLSGGTDGVDYQLRWTITDSVGNVWPRTLLVLCAETS
jgi:hypothetical protein